MLVSSNLNLGYFIVSIMPSLVLTCFLHLLPPILYLTLLSIHPALNALTQHSWSANHAL